LDRPDSSAVAGAGGVQRGAAEFLPGGPAAAVVSVVADPGLHRVLQRHDIPLPAQLVSNLFVAANNVFKVRLPGLVLGAAVFVPLT
jgi:hypothetical protein